MTRSTLLAALLLAAALPAALPSGAAARDARLVHRAFNADEVVRVEGRLGVQASIAFADDEHIENVAVGDANTWQITPNKRANLLFVKPLAARAQTNMTVVTDKRTYFFDLVAAPGGSPLYVLRFTYPDEPRPAPRLAAAPAVMSDVEAQAASGAVTEKPADPAELNFAWVPRGSSTLLPARIYDDGQATFLSWATGKPIPAILVRNEKGAEGPVNFAVRSDVIVIDGVPQTIVLRSGRDLATLENRGSARKPGAVPVIAPAVQAAPQTAVATPVTALPAALAASASPEGN